MEYQKQYREQNKNKHICEKCNYNTSLKSDLTKHFKSKKHLQKNNIFEFSNDILNQIISKI